MLTLTWYSGYCDDWDMFFAPICTKSAVHVVLGIMVACGTGGAC